MRHLIVCCDGTWNTPEQESVTNVARLYNALTEKNEDGIEQLPYYHPGVGAEGSLLNWVLGGAAGAGLSRNVMSAYHWLTTTYQRGDRIALFGFSRGAYTVRSLAGMIATCGLIDTTCLDEATIRRQIEHLYHRRYRRRYRAFRNADPRWQEGLTFTFHPERAHEIPVHFIGVWDTVGSLGIPDTLGVINLLLDPPHRYNFHDVKLNPHIDYARHAVAMDELRATFTPTLWEWAPEQNVKEVWFPGSHLDVGGGHREMGLSDGALKWMIKEARDAIGLAFHKTTEDQIRPNPLDIRHDDNRGVFGLLELVFDPVLEPVIQLFIEPRPRAVPLIDPQVIDPQDRNPAVDDSVYERQQNPPITTGPYRPTRVLAMTDSKTVDVFAREPWNATGLYLEVGDYTFAAQGEWLDAWIRSGPAGTTGLRRFSPIQGLRLLGTLIGQGEKLFRWVTGNEMANCLFTRREENMPWMSLVGVVANDAKAVKGAAPRHECIAIGAGTSHHVCRAGYLYAFANDAWGFYNNNRGSVRLTVTRTA